MVVCGELLITLLYLCIIFLINSLNIATVCSYQGEYPLLLNLVVILNIIIILILLEVNKSPFDLTEAETELVTGFHTEYGAFFFALFYLGEYFHIFFTSGIMVYILTGF
jgi:NADH:ubiquinone oxidoreductase subunit H